MKKLNKLILTRFPIEDTLCTVCASVEDNRIMELRIEPVGTRHLLGNIYVGQVENISANISAAFVQIAPGERCYFPLSEEKDLIYAAGRPAGRSLRAGDEILVQVSREAMKGKLPALTSNLNLPGKYLVLTTGEKKIGLSGKLAKEDRSRLCKWLEEEITRPEKEYGLIVRTNAAEASKEEFLEELAYLKKKFEKIAENGRNRTCFSLLHEAEPLFLTAVRDAYRINLQEIVTDIPEIHGQIQEYLEMVSPKELNKLRFYEDSLLPLYKMYRMETALEEIRHEKVWLNSGGFLVIQQTEAFVSIDVNSGKYTGNKKKEETFRKINLEAAEEIGRQLRLRNLSGIILIDFINMENPDHQSELFHVLQKILRRDSVRCKAVDITPLHILEMTRKKVRRPVAEDLRELRKL